MFSFLVYYFSGACIRVFLHNDKAEVKGKDTQVERPGW